MLTQLAYGAVAVACVLPAVGVRCGMASRPWVFIVSPFVKMIAWNARGAYLHTQNLSKKEKTLKTFVVLSEKSVIAPVKRAEVCLASCQ